MPSVASNTKFRCGGCQGIFDFQLGVLGPGACPNCGAYEWHQITIVSVCDFCGEPEVHWRFPCRAFEMPSPAPGPVRLSGDDWAACDPCKELIEADDLKALSRRAVDLAIKRKPRLKRGRVEIEAVTRRLHRDFAANRTGPAIRLSEE